MLYEVQKHPLEVPNVLLFESVFNSLHLPVYRCVSYVVLSPAAVLQRSPGSDAAGLNKLHRCL